MVLVGEILVPEFNVVKPLFHYGILSSFSFLLAFSVKLTNNALFSSLSSHNCTILHCLRFAHVILQKY